MLITTCCIMHRLLWRDCGEGTPLCISSSRARPVLVGSAWYPGLGMRYEPKPAHFCSTRRKSAKRDAEKKSAKICIFLGERIPRPKNFPLFPFKFRQFLHAFCTQVAFKSGQLIQNLYLGAPRLFFEGGQFLF